MADTNKRLAGPTALGTSAATIYTVPAATQAVIRSIHAANTSAGDRTFRISIGADAAGTRIFHDQPVRAGDSFDWSGSITLEAAETLQAYGDAAGVTLTVSGVVTT